MRRGGLLIEMVVAIALFASAGLIVTGSMRDGVRASLRAIEREQATDIAASAFALVEAGIETVDTIDGAVPPWQDPEDESQFADIEPEPTGWAIEAQIERSPYGALTRLTVTALRATPDGQPIPGSPDARVDGLVHIARVLEDTGVPENTLEEELQRIEGGG